MIFGKSNNKKFVYFKLLFYYFKVLGLASMTCDTLSTKNTTNHYWSFTRSKSAIVYNVIFILLLVMSNINSVTYFCSSDYRVNFDTIADCGKTIMSTFVVLVILVKSCISRNSLINIANSISQVTESLLTLSSTSIQKNNKVSLDNKIIFTINVTIWFVLFASMALETMPWTKYAISIHFSNFILNVLMTQYSVILKFLEYNYKLLNENLIEFGHEESIKVRSSMETKTKIDRLSQLQKLHDSLSDASRDVSNFYSYLMLVCILDVFVILIFVGYYLTKPMIFYNTLTGIMLLRCFWFGFVYVVLLVTLTKSVTDTIGESRRTKEIISSCLVMTADEKVLNKLNQFSIYLLHRDVKFTVLGLFSLEQSLLTSMAGSIATYMVIVLQFQQNGC